MDDVEEYMQDILRLYIAIWNWHMMGYVTLLFVFLFFVLKVTYMGVALIFIFGFCEFMSMKRRKELLKNE